MKQLAGFLTFLVFSTSCFRGTEDAPTSGPTPPDAAAPASLNSQETTVASDEDLTLLAVTFPERGEEVPTALGEAVLKLSQNGHLILDRVVFSPETGVGVLVLPNWDFIPEGAYTVIGKAPDTLMFIRSGQEAQGKIDFDKALGAPSFEGVIHAAKGGILLQIDEVTDLDGLLAVLHARSKAQDGAKLGLVGFIGRLQAWILRIFNFTPAGQRIAQRPLPVQYDAKKLPLKSALKGPLSKQRPGRQVGFSDDVEEEPGRNVPPAFNRALKESRKSPTFGGPGVFSDPSDPEGRDVLRNRIRVKFSDPDRAAKGEAAAAAAFERANPPPRGRPQVPIPGGRQLRSHPPARR